MSASKDLDRLIQSFLAEGPLELPNPSYDAVRERMEETRQRAVIGPWRTSRMGKTMQYGLAAAAVIVAIIGLRTLTAGPTPGGSPSAEPSASATASAPSSAFDDVLNGFLAARVAGAGAEEYLDLANTAADDFPLLYATTSGAPYDRAEFEPLLGVEWPYGWTAFKVRLFAGDIVVEQLVFSGPDSSGLNYQRDGFGTEIPPTTENGQPVAMSYTYFDGSLTLQAAHPWVFSGTNTYANPFWMRLIPEGPGVLPTTDAGERQDWDRLVLMADPVLVGDCQPGPDPADAAALAESIRSNPDLGASAPVAVRVGGAEALMMDVVIAAGTTITVPANAQGDLCWDGVLSLVFDRNAAMYTGNGVLTGQATGDWMRLYLFDAPEGSSMRIQAIAIVAPESRFERAVEAAAPVVDSVEFHAP